ncbi:diguanylate cyclase [Hoeflea sp. TYP-13]|uniref:diguanylate cyclase n=1 Tax=Hoeflea sp. TYP-13 TaxID=3230023 RepID=UPI0034C67540
MRIRELLVQKVQIELKSVQPNLSLLDAAGILSANNIGALPVVGDADNIIGIISERDLIRSFVEFEGQCMDKLVSDIMTTSVITCRTDDLMDDVYEIMSAKKVRHIPVVENGKLHAMLSIRDFEIAHKRLISQSLSDGLTGLHNHHHFLNVLDGEFNRFRRFRSPLSVATIKVDRIAQIREEKGHAAGDALLKKLAEILVEQTRAYDGIGRTADDRFAIVFPNTDAKTAIRACERIVGAVNAHSKGAEWSTISIGLAHADHENGDGMSILNKADQFVQAAAAAGGDSIEAPEAHEPEQPDSATSLSAKTGFGTRNSVKGDWPGAH